METTTLPSGATIDRWGETHKEDRAAQVTMPAGAYWVGDPCYAVQEKNDDWWQQWLEDAYGGRDGNNVAVLLAEVNGMPVLGINTAYGDGVYEDQSGYDYPVDAGLIGLVPAELWKGDQLYTNGEPDGNEAPFGMHYHEFPEPFACRYLEEGGTIQLGEITIKTDPKDDYYDPDYYG
jgi:hypothetical protein